MTVTVVIEGFRVTGTAIARKSLISVWRKLTQKRFPPVAAFQLEDEDFDYIMKSRKCKDDERREMQEWGRVLSIRGTDACVFNVSKFDNFEYVILIRKNPYHALEEVLEHELSHIIKGDL